MSVPEADRGAGVRVSVLLATYNRRALLPEVLAPLLADPATDEIVVVVDGSQDGSLELLTEMAERDARLRPHFIENSGAARALLSGARVARGEILVILDDDEIVSPGAVSGHAAHHAADEDLVVVGYVTMAMPPRRRPGDFSRYVYAEQYERDCRTYERDPGSILLNLWGGFISMRRDRYVQAVTGGPALIEGYHYDLDFGARCMELGLSARFDRSLRALHLYERDRDAYLRDARGSGRNRILVHRAHPQVLPAIDPTFVDRGLPPLGRIALRVALRVPLVLLMIGAATTVAGRLRLWHLEENGAALMWAVEQKRGALETVRRLSATI